MINKDQIMKKILIIVGLISVIILISLLVQQKITEQNEAAQQNKSEFTETQQNQSEFTEIQHNQTAPIKEQRKSEFICPKPPAVCFCKNFLSLNRPILNKDDLDDAVELFLMENDMRKENVSIDIGEGGQGQQKGWYFVTVTNMTSPYYRYTFSIDNSTGDFWYIFGCV